MIFGFGLLAKIVLAWTRVFLIVVPIGVAFGIKQVETRRLRRRPENRQRA